MSNYVQHAVFEHKFWLEILKDHGQFIHDSLYPSEVEDINTANSFIHQFAQLLAFANTLNASDVAVTFALTVDETVEQFKQFKFHILRRQLSGKIGIHLTPTFVNHMVNELEEYQNVLSYLKKKVKSPLFS